jgi:carboxyl-terminal processing protease
MGKWLLSLCCLGVTTTLLSTAAAPAELTPIDVMVRSKEMMTYHPTFKRMESMLAIRLLSTFCDELDPSKTYFLKNEVSEWIDPSEETISRALSAFDNGKFDMFEEMLRLMGKAIARRETLEARLEEEDLIPAATIRFHEMDWADDAGVLYERLRSIRSAQVEAAEHLDQGLCRTALFRIKKRRLAFEQQRQPKEGVSFKQTVDTFIMKAFASALDSQSAYFTPSEAKQLLAGMQQRLFGIGILLRDDIDGFSVIKVVEGGPSDRQKALELGDKIIAIDDEPVIGLDIMDVVEMIRGEPGSTIALKIVRRRDDGGKEAFQPMDIRLRRGEVVVKDSRYGSQTVPYDDGVMTYLRLHSFYQDDETSSYADLLSELERCQKQHEIKGVILDLRYNPGGLLGQAVAVAGLFMEKGIVVSMKNEAGELTHMRNIASKRMWNGPLVILLNRASASASEIVAQALQDWGAAIVVGDDRSFGKGSYQLFTLNPNGAAPPNPKGEFKVTRGRYYTVSGKTPQLTGVQSDIIVPGLLCFTEIGERYSKYPLMADSVLSHFDDTFEDVPAFQRSLLRRLYSIGHQERVDRWRRLLPDLRYLSKKRIGQNAEYQKCIEDAKKASDFINVEEARNARDWQLEEAWNVLKDMIAMTAQHVNVHEQHQASA